MAAEDSILETLGTLARQISDRVVHAPTSYKVAAAVAVAGAVGYSYWKKTEFDAEHYFDAKPLASEAAAGTAAAAGGGGGGGGGGSVDGASRLGPADLPWTGDEDALARDCGALIEELRGSFFAGHSRPLRTRLRELRNLLRMFEENEDAMLEALAADLGRPRQEGLLYDILIPKAEINHMIAHLHDWVRPERKGDSLVTFPATSLVYKEPYGVALIIGTWNYPLMLTLVPLAGAIAAGNVAILKPCRVAAATSELLGRLVPKYLDPKIVKVVGFTHPRDRPTTNALLAHRLDYIFFTGGPEPGAEIMKRAAAHLTPCTLELGGKNPVFVAADADVDLAAKRTVWGRMMNAGQQCIAPDFVLVDRRVERAFLDACKKWVEAFYEGHPEVPGVIGRIVNDKRMELMKTLLDTHAEQVVVGGTYDVATRYVAPTVMLMKGSEPCMQEETFGPILMVVAVESMDEAIRFVNARPKPLSMYIFASCKATQERIVQNTAAGGVTINGTLFHCAHPELPFGGVGRSGMGSYHGKKSFDTFTHEKPVLRKSALPDGGLLSDPFFLYPPWTAGGLKESLIRLLLR